MIHISLKHLNETINGHLSQHSLEIKISMKMANYELKLELRFY